MQPDAAKMTWADLEAIILDEHRHHRSYPKVERHTRVHSSESIYRRYSITNETDLRAGLAKVAENREDAVKGRIGHTKAS